MLKQNKKHKKDDLSGEDSYDSLGSKTDKMDICYIAGSKNEGEEEKKQKL